jgi:hypothetical protein
MIVKHEQAVVGIAMQATKVWGRNSVSVESLAIRDVATRLIKELNATPRLFSPRACEFLSCENIESKFAAASPVDLARMASYVDAEGTIYINRTKPSGVRVSPVFSLSLCVINTSSLLLTWLQDTFGGNVHAHGKNTVKPCWSWSLSSKQAEVALRNCLPYFLLKRGQAEAGIAFRRLIDSQKTSKVADVDIQAREDLRNKIHALNSPLAEDVSAQGDSRATFVQ